MVFCYLLWEKNCSCDWEKLLQNFYFWDHLKFKQWNVSTIFEAECFFYLVPVDFSDVIEQFESKLEKLVRI